MNTGDGKQLKLALFASLRAQLEDHGFILRAPKETFVRQRDEKTDMFQLVCLDGKPGWRIQPNVAVRVDRIEELFHRVSGFELKYQRDTPTIGGAIGNIMADDNRACEFLLESTAEITHVSGEIIRVFRDFALPYFDKFSSLSAIDAEINDRPTERTPHRVASWLRCATGIIVAKLVCRPGYQELVETYREVMAHSDKGFYLNRFEALVKLLETWQY